MRRLQPPPATIPGKRVMGMQVFEPEYLGFVLNTPEKVRKVILERMQQWHWSAQDVADWANVPERFPRKWLVLLKANTEATLENCCYEKHQETNSYHCSFLC